MGRFLIHNKLTNKYWALGYWVEHPNEALHFSEILARYYRDLFSEQDKIAGVLNSYELEKV